MRPTEEGWSLATGLREGFGRIAATCRDLLERDADRPLRLALTPSLAANWLMPRITEFWRSHPDIAIDFVPANDTVDLRTDGFDLAIRYGRGPWTGVVAERLMEVKHVVVAAPGIAEPQTESLAPLAKHMWFLEMTSHEDLLWAKRWGLPERGTHIRRFPTVSMVLEAARAGHGLGIVPRALAEAGIDRGDFTVLFEDGDSDLGYHILIRDDRPPSQPLKAVIHWLKDQAS